MILQRVKLEHTDLIFRNNAELGVDRALVDLLLIELRELNYLDLP